MTHLARYTWLAPLTLTAAIGCKTDERFSIQLPKDGNPGNVQWQTCPPKTHHDDQTDDHEQRDAHENHDDHDHDQHKKNN